MEQEIVDFYRLCLEECKRGGFHRHRIYRSELYQRIKAAYNNLDDVIAKAEAKFGLTDYSETYLRNDIKKALELKPHFGFTGLNGPVKDEEVAKVVLFHVEIMLGSVHVIAYKFKHSLAKAQEVALDELRKAGRLPLREIDFLSQYRENFTADAGDLNGTGLSEDKGYADMPESSDASP